MSVIPSGFHAGTTLNPSITSYETMSIRIQHLLGAPLINLEISDDQVYHCITEAIEFFTQWAGYTEEYLVFDSRLYKPGVGIKVDDLINRTTEMSNGTGVSGVSAAYDYDLASYRKVIDCFSFDRGEDTGINTLFTLEQAMSQSIYSSYMVGNFGFDLITWEVLKGFIDTRNKVLAMTDQFRFDSRTQLLRILPEPRDVHTYKGVVGCYIERPIKDIVREKIVLKLAMAHVKVAIARTREKYPGTNMFGGGSVNAASLLSEGIAEIEKFQEEIKQSYTWSNPTQFFIG